MLLPYHLIQLVESLAVPPVADLFKTIHTHRYANTSKAQKSKFPRDVPERHKRHPIACQPFRYGD